jgi:hypothetical protein
LLASGLGGWFAISDFTKLSRFHYPTLPESIEEVRFGNLTVGDGSVDLVLTRDHDAMSVGITRRTGKIDVITIC